MAKIIEGRVILVVNRRPDRGKQGQFLRSSSSARQLIVEGIQRVQRHVKRARARRHEAGHHHDRGADPRVERDACRPADQKEAPAWLPPERCGARWRPKRTVRVRVAKRSGKDV